MQRYSGKLKDAEKNYKIALDHDPDDILAQNGLESCRLIQDWKDNPTRYTVKKDNIMNGRYADWSPVYASPDYDQIVFTSCRNECAGDDVNPITGMKSCESLKISKNSLWLSGVISFFIISSH